MTFVRQDSGKVIFSLLEPKPREGRKLNFPHQSDDDKGAYGC